MVRLHWQHQISSIPLLICNKHRYLRSSVALVTHWKEYDCLNSTQIKRGDPYSSEAHMKPMFLWLFTATVIANVQAFITHRISLASMTSMMSAAEQGGVQPQPNVVPSAGGGCGPGRDTHGGGSRGRGRVVETKTTTATKHALPAVNPSWMGSFWITPVSTTLTNIFVSRTNWSIFLEETQQNILTSSLQQSRRPPWMIQWPLPILTQPTCLPLSYGN